MAITDIITGAASLAKGLVTPTRAVDVVAITGAGFAPLFAQARPLVANVYEYADIMEHPLETGSVIADHIVFQPTEIELPLVCVGELAYRSTYAALRSTFKAGALLTIRTRTSSYSNMVIIDLPHEETPDAFDAVAIRLRLREARFVSPKTGLSQSQVKNPSQASTANRGNQQTKATSAANSNKATSQMSTSSAGPGPRGSTLHQWFGQ